jgi:hypothetical protein
MVSRAVQALTSVSLAGAAGLTFAAAWQRWWPACPRGDFDNAVCTRLQSHEYDYLVPSPPWTPLGHAAELAGASLLALAVAALLLPAVLEPPVRRARRRVGWRVGAALLAVVPGAGLALLGLVTIRSGSSGHAVTIPVAVDLAIVVWALVWPFALMVFALAATATHLGPSWRAPLVAALIGLSTPAPTALLFGPMFASYTSYDTAPWTEAASAPFLLAAAIVVWPGRLRRSSKAPVVEQTALPAAQR